MTSARTIGAMIVAAGGLVALSGCGRDATTEAVYESDIRFSEVAGGPAPEPQFAQEVYGQIETLLQPVAGKGPEGAAEAASILLGAAQHGQAADAATNAAQLEAQVRHRLSIVRGQAAEWSRLTAQAEAAASYDPAPEFAELDQHLQDRRRDLGELEGKQRDAQARLADLQAQIDDLRAQATEARSAAGAVQLEMSRGTAQQAAALAPQARDLMLKADTLDLEAQRVETALEQFAPEAYEIDLGIARLEKQRELLTRTRTEVTARARAAEDDEQKSRAGAERASRELDRLVSELQEFRATELAAAFDRATGLVRNAIKNAKAARNEAGNTGAMTAGMSQQALGDLELRRAQSALMVSNTMQTLEALGLGAKYAALADEAHKQAEEHHAAAMEAFSGAASSYRAVRLRGGDDQLRQAADALDRYAETPLGQTPDLSAPPEPEDTGLGDTGFDDGTPDGEASDDTEAPDADDGG